jgi:hypothetical protein
MDATYSLSANFAQRRWAWAGLGLLWLAGAVAGLAMLFQYAGRPGAPATPPAAWPKASGLALAKSGATLVMFVHPRCPCTRASLEELEKLIARCGSAVTPFVVFLKPKDSADDWEQTDLWRAAARTPGVHVVCDVEGLEARRFGAKTSGQTMLFDPRGRLLFSGGITAARGHAGDNAGRSAIEALARGELPVCRETPVFGCPIANAQRQAGIQ